MSVEYWNSCYSENKKREDIITICLIFNYSLYCFKTPKLVREIEWFKNEREGCVPTTHSLDGGLQVQKTLLLYKFKEDSMHCWNCKTTESDMEICPIADSTGTEPRPASNTIILFTGTVVYYTVQHYVHLAVSHNIFNKYAVTPHVQWGAH